MSKLIVCGPSVIDGEIFVCGAKNSALPSLAATILTEETVYLHNCPYIRDVRKTFEIIECLGGKVSHDGNTACVNCKGVCSGNIPNVLMREMRSSIIFIGALISRVGKVRFSCPGGCELGPRPIDLHINSLRQLGVYFEYENDAITAYCNGLKGADIVLEYPSVGATENIILAAACANGRTTITGAAKEPEIVDLQNLLNAMGAKISGAGTDFVEVEGVSSLCGTHHAIIGDRIEAATYLAAAAMTTGHIVLKGCNCSHLEPILSVLENGGAEISLSNDKIELLQKNRPVAPSKIITRPYPDFPTDALAIFVAYSAVAEGNCELYETVFQNRFEHVGQLLRFGANIRAKSKYAWVGNADRLNPADVYATDLRGGAAMTLMALCAWGESSISNFELVERGYEDMSLKLNSLGSKTERK